jgi:hypothetical protein
MGILYRMAAYRNDRRGKLPAVHGRQNNLPVISTETSATARAERRDPRPLKKVGKPKNQNPKNKKRTRNAGSKKEF